MALRVRLADGSDEVYQGDPDTAYSYRVDEQEGLTVSKTVTRQEDSEWIETWGIEEDRRVTDGTTEHQAGYYPPRTWVSVHND